MLAAQGSSGPAPSTARPPTPTAATAVAGAQCLPPVPSGLALPDPSTDNQAVATSPGRPGERLTLSATARSAKPGSAVIVHAVLAVPAQVLAPAGTAAASPQSVPQLSLAPCVSVVIAGATQPAAQAGVSAAPGAAAGTGATVLVGVPMGLTAGSVLTIVASVPAGFPYAGTPPLSAQLRLTVA